MLAAIATNHPAAFVEVGGVSVAVTAAALASYLAAMDISRPQCLRTCYNVASALECGTRSGDGREALMSTPAWFENLSYMAAVVGDSADAPTYAPVHRELVVTVIARIASNATGLADMQAQAESIERLASSLGDNTPVAATRLLGKLVARTFGANDSRRSLSNTL